MMFVLSVVCRWSLLCPGPGGLSPVLDGSYPIGGTQRSWGGSEGRWMVTGGHECDSVEDNRLMATCCCFFVRRLEQGWLGRCLVELSWGRS